MPISTKIQEKELLTLKLRMQFRQQISLPKVFCRNDARNHTTNQIRWNSGLWTVFGTYNGRSGNGTRVSHNTSVFLCQHPNINAPYSHFINFSTKLHNFSILKHRKCKNSHLNIILTLRICLQNGLLESEFLILKVIFLVSFRNSACCVYI